MLFNEFELITTEDGSPSLKPANSEPMHSSKGAFSETLYIYRHGLKEAYSIAGQLNSVSVGIGLGYNEMLWASFCLSNNLHTYYLHSFESHKKLSSSFKNWLEDKDTPLQTTYNQILSLYATEFKISEKLIKDFLFKKLNHSFIMSSALTAKNQNSLPFHCILYDAYSSSTSPQLWEENFLREFLENYAAPNSAFTTYAATSVLTKSLTQQGFTVKKRKGFGFKRESTLAIKQP